MYLAFMHCLLFYHLVFLFLHYFHLYVLINESISGTLSLSYLRDVKLVDVLPDLVSTHHF